MNATQPIDWNTLTPALQARAAKMVRKALKMSEEDAADVVSEAAFRIVRTQAIVQHPLQFLVKSAINVEISRRNRTKDQGALRFAVAHDSSTSTEAADHAEELADAEEQALRAERLHAAMAELRDIDRFLLTAYYFEGKKIAGWRLFRARARLLKIFRAMFGRSEESG